MFKRFAVSILGAIMLLALASFAAPRTAEAAPGCTSYIWIPSIGPGGGSYVCVAWTMPAGAQVCTSGSAQSGEALIYTGTNYTGVCMRLPVGFSSDDFGPSGWKNSIGSMKVGTGAHVYACNVYSFLPNCSTMGSPYGYLFPNTSGPSNWWSMRVTN